MNIDNFIGTEDSAFSKQFCSKAIDYYETMVSSGFGIINNTLKTKIQRDSTTVFATDSKLINLQASNELSREFNSLFWSKYYPEYLNKYPSLESTSVGINQLKIQKILPGQGYHLWHYESSTADSANRLLVFMVYLNDIIDGGETEFLYIGKRIKPSRGKLAIFPAGFTHTHRGNPPLNDIKYIINGWVEV